MTPAIFFEPDGYVVGGPRIMGRQSAGNGFLRAAAKAHGGREIHALVSGQAAFDSFRDLVLKAEPTARPTLIGSNRLDAVAQLGLLYRPDVNIVAHARARLRLGPAAYSICGVTHTLCSHGPADLLADTLAGPVMPWDAVICTSTVARAFAEDVLDAQEDYLAWRFGQRPRATRPQLPVIPLGVHAADFAFEEGERQAARAALGLTEDEVVALFAGRLTINGKAHPYQTYRAFERAAQATGRKLVLLHAGQFPTPELREAFTSAAATWAPSVRTLFVDGSEADAFARTWRAADLFVSLADSIQETFGITPLEAMAAGLPLLVSDWNGYKDTVPDGVAGYRVPTWAPAPGAGTAIAWDYETDAINYDFFLSRTSTTVSLDLAVLDARLTELVSDAALRRRMGEAGRAHVRRTFDWAVVYARYEALWRELAEIRASAARDPALAGAPASAPTRGDPFTRFAAYPTRHIGLDTRVRAREGASLAAYETLTAHPTHSFWRAPPEFVSRVLADCAGEGATVRTLVEALGEPAPRVIERLGRLAKLELVALAPGQGED